MLNMPMMRVLSRYRKAAAPTTPIPTTTSTPVTKPVQSFKKGGLVHQTGVYRLHKGEAVMTKGHVNNWLMSDTGVMALPKQDKTEQKTEVKSEAKTESSLVK